MSGFLKYSLEQHVATITIDRPPVNALSVAAVEELWEIVGSIESSDDVRVVVISGGEKHFSAGMDIRELEDDVATDPRLAIPAARRFDQVFKRMSGLKQPVISAVNGYALGGGFMLTLYCDVRIGSQGSSYGLPEIGLGGLPSFGLQRVVRTIGASQTKRLVLTGDRVDADEALRLGLIDVLVPEGEALREALLIAGRIARHPIVSVRLNKRAVDLDAELSIDLGAEINFALADQVAGTADRREALLAFLEKRSPNFVGH
jgi:enoyl-CoA hydratase